jgi:hypothetical protein
MCEERLESLVMISCEKDILIDTDEVGDGLAHQDTYHIGICHWPDGRITFFC